jgi:hypothetical protein
VVLRVGDVLRDVAHECAAKRRFRALVGGDQEVLGGEALLHVLRDEVLDEGHGLLRRPLGDEPAVDAAERVRRLALAAGHGREVDPGELVVADAGLVRGEDLLRVVEGRDREDHRGLAVAEMADRLLALEAQEAILERLQVDELLEELTRLLEGLALEAAVLALQRRVEGRLAADAAGEMRPVEMHGPFVGPADRDRRDAGGLQLLRGVEQVVPGLDAGGVDARLGEQLLVGHEADLRDGVRQAVDLAVDGEGRDGARRELVLVVLHLGRDVLEDAGLDLRLQHAAGPAVDDVGPVARLQQRRRLGLVGLVLEVLHVDLDAGVLGLEVARDLLPDLHLGGIGLDVEPFNGRLRLGQPGRQREPGHRQKGAPADCHDVLPIELFVE